jgi:apolipoprotein N-acyltransferase
MGCRAPIVELCIPFVKQKGRKSACPESSVREKIKEFLFDLINFAVMMEGQNLLCVTAECNHQHKHRCHMNKKDFCLILSSAVLLILSFPKINQAYFTWIALVPILYALEGKSAYQSFIAGLLCGYIFYTGLIYWIVVVTTTYGGLNYPVGIFVMLLLVTYLSLYCGLAFSLARFIEEKTSCALPTILPFIWVALEYLRSFLFTGFPWESLGYAHYQSRLVIQCADITGVYGISFLIVYVNASVYLLLRGIAVKKIPWKESVLATLMLIVALSYGTWRLATIKKATAAAGKIQCGLIQGNIDQGIKWNRTYRNQVIARHQQLSREALYPNTRLLIWPESSTPFYFQSEIDYQQAIFDIISDKDVFLLLGSPSMEERNGKLHNFNSAFLLSPSQKIAGKYDKKHLVPYGEYIPLKRFFPFINKMVAGIGDFSSGSTITLLHLPEASFGVLICYEIIFPDLTRRFVKKGAQFLVNITNDAWFGKTSAPYQHLSMAVVRAIENRRWIARAANTGISAFIDATGAIKSATPLFTESFLTGTIGIVDVQTFYTTYGDIFALLATLLSLVLLCYAVFRNRKG